jgi:hypothetical protein
VKVVSIAAAVAVACLPLYANAASAGFEDSVRQQLEQLTERLNKLEQENTRLTSTNQALAAENAQLKAQDAAQSARVVTSQDAIEAQAAAVAPVRNELRQIADKDAKSADSSTSIAFKGDLRYRYEHIEDDTLNGMGVRTADRDRQRIRARFGVAVKATDNINVAVQLATTERQGTEDNGDPRASNFTFGDEFSRKRIDLDQVYFDWNFTPGFNLQGGKVPLPFKRTGQSFFYDGDVNPEGLAVLFKRGQFFGTGYAFSLREVSGAENTNTSDAYMSGVQFGATLPVGSSSLVAAAMFTDYSAVENRAPAPFYAGNSNGNTVTAGGLLANDFNIVELSAELNIKLGNLPFQIWADGAQNTEADDEDTAYGVGVVLGKATDPGTWEVGVGYSKIEADALFGQFFDSDFGAGFTDSEGVVIKGGYAVAKNWVLNGSYFLNKRGVELGQDADYDRLQLDLNLKF